MGGFRRLVVAECLEDRGRFIPKIADYVDAFAAQRSWTLPAHDGTLTCFNGAPHLDHARGVRKIPGHWWLHAGNNWNSVCNACVVHGVRTPTRRA